MDGVSLAARFSLATNRLAFCGPQDAEPVLYRAITEAAARPAARRMLSQFEALMPYLEAIGRKHGLDPFDARVVEAYWIGNELLDSFDRQDFRALLDALIRRGLPASMAQRLAEHLPDHPIPHHAFHVAFVGVGSVTGHVETTLANLELCRPAWTEVAAVSQGRLATLGPGLEVEAGRLRLGAAVRAEYAYDPAVLPGVQAGDSVVLHWRWPALVLSPEERRSLERYSLQAWAAANQALPGLHALE